MKCLLATQPALLAALLTLLAGLPGTASAALPNSPSSASAPKIAPVSTSPTTPNGGNTGTGGRPAPLSPLPPARAVDAILVDVVTAVGGAAALGKHRSMHTKMEITFKGLGITGTAEHYAAVGDKALTITEIPNLASTREGSDGKNFWSDDPINGLRLLEGVEAEQARTEVAWNAELRMKELYPKIEVKNERKPEANADGGYWECLVLTPKSGPGMTSCFDAKTHLLALQRGVRSGPQGDMPFTARLLDWRMLKDVKMSYATDMQVGPLAFSGRVVLAEIDVPVESTMFEVPKVTKGETAKRGGGGSAAGGKAPSSGGAKKGHSSKEPAAPQEAGSSSPSSPSSDKH